jgi:hypothetical protein
MTNLYINLQPAARRRHLRLEQDGERFKLYDPQWPARALRKAIHAFLKSDPKRPPSWSEREKTQTDKGRIAR